jgi:hypothetical protein
MVKNPLFIMGKMLLFIGGVIILLGIIILLSSKIKIPFLGHLPGDIQIKGKNFVFYFPIVTCILLSLLLSLILTLCSRK